MLRGESWLDDCGSRRWQCCASTEAQRKHAEWVLKARDELKRELDVLAKLKSQAESATQKQVSLRRVKLLEPKKNPDWVRAVVQAGFIYRARRAWRRCARSWPLRRPRRTIRRRRWRR